MKGSLPGIVVFDARCLGELRHSLTYFAISVIWRMSAGYHRWRDVALSPRRLGPFEDAMRPYLLGETGKPPFVEVQVQAVAAGLLFNYIQAPQGKNAGTHYQYEFWVPGMIFTIHVGRRIKRETAVHALSSEDSPQLEVRALDALPAARDLIKRAIRVPARGKLAREERRAAD